MPENKTCWKNNLACLTIVKARELEINIRTESDLWTTIGYGTKIRELVETRIWKRSGVKISETGLTYLKQLIDTDKKRLITWQQFKNYKINRAKAKKHNGLKQQNRRYLKGQKVEKLENALKQMDKILRQ